MRHAVRAGISGFRLGGRRLSTRATGQFSRVALQGERHHTLQLGMMRFASTKPYTEAPRFSKAVKLAPLGVLLALSGSAFGYNCLVSSPERARESEIRQLNSGYHQDLDLIQGYISKCEALQDLQLNGFERWLMARLIVAKFVRDHKDSPHYAQYPNDWWPGEQVVIEHIDAITARFESIVKYRELLDNELILRAADKLLNGDMARLESVLDFLNAFKLKESANDYLQIVLDNELQQLPPNWDSSFNSAAHLQLYMMLAKKFALRVEEINQLDIKPFNDDSCNAEQLRVAFNYMLEHEGLKWREVVSRVNSAMQTSAPTAQLMQCINEHKIAQKLGVEAGSVTAAGVDWDPSAKQSEQRYMQMQHLVDKAALTPQQAFDLIASSKDEDGWEERIGLMQAGVPFDKARDVSWPQYHMRRIVQKGLDRGVLTQQEVQAAGLYQGEPQFEGTYLWVSEAFSESMRIALIDHCGCEDATAIRESFDWAVRQNQSEVRADEEVERNVASSPR